MTNFAAKKCTITTNRVGKAHLHTLDSQNRTFSCKKMQRKKLRHIYSVQKETVIFRRRVRRPMCCA